MGSAVDALLAEDEKKRKQQSGSSSQDSGVSYVNNTPSGSNVDKLLQSTQSPSYKPPQDAYTQPSYTQQQQKPQPVQKKQPGMWDNISKTFGNGVSNLVNATENFFSGQQPQNQQPIQINPVNQDLKKKLPLTFNPSQSDNQSAQMTGNTPQQSQATATSPGKTMLEPGKAPTVWNKFSDYLANFFDKYGDASLTNKEHASEAYTIQEKAYQNIVQQTAKKENKLPAQVDQEFQNTANNIGLGGSKYDIASLKSGVKIPSLTTLTQQGTIFKNAPIQQIYKEIGVSDAPTDADFTGLLMTAALGLGIAAAPEVAGGAGLSLLPGAEEGAAGTKATTLLKDLGLYSGVNEVKSNFIAALTGQPIGLGQNHSLSDLAPNSNSTIQTTLDVLDFLGTGAVTGAILKASPAVFEKMTKDTITTYGSIPETLQFSPEQVQNVVKGSEVGKVKDDLARLGLTSEQWREASLHGIQVQMPTEKIATLVDKPYWQTLKGLLNIPPSEPKVTVDSTGKVINSIAGYLPEGATPAGDQSVTPQEPAGMPSVVKQEFTKPAAEPVPGEPSSTDGSTPNPTPEPKTIGDFKALAEQNNVTVPDEFKTDTERKAVAYVLTHAEELTQKYLETYPDEINGDKAKDLLTHIGYNKTNATEYDVAGGILSKMAFDAQLKAHDLDADKTILFTAGGPGSGKTSAMGPVKENKDYSFVFDSNLANPTTAKKMIEQAKEAGYSVDVYLTDRPIETAYKEGVLKRYKEGEKRTVPINTHVNNHIAARETVVHLAEHYEDDNAVQVGAIANHGSTPGSAVPMSLDEVKKLAYDYNEKKQEITNKLHEYTKESYQSGEHNLTADQYKALTGAEAPEIRRQNESGTTTEATKGEESTGSSATTTTTGDNTGRTATSVEKLEHIQKGIELASKLTEEQVLSKVANQLQPYIERNKTPEEFSSDVVNQGGTFGNFEGDYTADRTHITVKLADGRVLKFTKKKVFDAGKQKVADSGIIQENEQTSQNTQSGNNTGQVPTTVPVGSEQSSQPNKNSASVNPETVQQRQGSDTNVSGNSGERPLTRTTQSERVDTVIGKSPKGRYQINKQVEDIIDSKPEADILNPDIYTPAEKALMEKYSGYGGINKDDTGRGALDEFFTPTKVTQFTWEKLSEVLGNSHIDTIIEPAVGTGRFIDTSPYPASSFTGYEINKYSAVVAKVLHPAATIHVQNFQELFMDGRNPVKTIEPIADLVIGNPPYGEYIGKYKGMGEGKQFKTFEEYFIGRGLALVTDGGHVAYVVQSSFLRGGTTPGKEAIAKLGTLVAAYRFPNSVFKESGTTIGTDLVIFKKQPGDVDTLVNDKYLIDHPENVLGNEVDTTDRFGKPTKMVEGDMSNIPVKEQVPVKNAVQSKRKTPALHRKTDIPAVVKKQTAAAKQLKKLYTHHVSQDTNKLISDITTIPPLELEGYKNLTTDGSLDEKFINRVNTFDKINHFSYENGKWYPDKAYIDSKNLYTLLDQLEADKDFLSPEQYQKQSKYIRDNLPAWTFVKDIKIDARHKMWDEIEVPDPQRSGQPVTLKNLFIRALYSYPNTMMEGLTSGDVVGYLTDSNVRAFTDDQKKFIGNSRARIANKLLNHFLSTVDELAPGAKDQVETYYNRSFNAYKTLSHEYIPLLNPVNDHFYNNSAFKLNQAQRDAIGFLLSRGKGIAALDVGIGKTLTGIIATGESFKRGWAKRAVVIVPNPSIGQQWINEIKLTQPEAHIYDMTNTANLDKLRGVQLLEKSYLLVTGDGMEKIGLTEDSYKAILPEISEAVSSLELNASARDRAKEGEKSDQLLGQAMQGTYSDLTWESLGIDLMTLDEAHNYNHIIGSVPSGAKSGERKINPYSGLNMQPSKRGVKAYVLGKHILKNNNQRNVFLMTATPFTNNPLEHYSMMSFVADKEMKDRGVYNVREYIQSFMQMENQSVVNPAGQIVDKQVVTNFTNFDAYQQLLSSAMIKIDGDDPNAGIVRPERVDKKVYVKTSEPQYQLANKLSQAYTALSAAIKKTADKEEKKKLSGQRLRVMTSLVANGFSPYASKFYQGKSPTAKQFVENTPKLKATAQMIKANLDKTKGQANSIVYMPYVKNEDLGIHFHQLYKDYLVKDMGIKADQVAIITGETSRAQRLAIQNSFNEGKTKVLLGTYAIAEGLNLQKKTTDVFITAPLWNYTQFRQLAGRAWRQGNEWDKVRIHLMMAEGTGDTFVAQKIMEKERRDKLINQAVKEGKVIKNESGDDLDFEEVLSSLLSDPVQRTMMQKTEEEKKLRSEIAGIDGQLQYARQLTDPYTISQIERDITNSKNNIGLYKSTLESKQNTLDLIEDKGSSQALSLEGDIQNLKGSIKSWNKKLTVSEARLAKIAEIVKRNNITDDYKTYLAKQLSDKQTELRNIEERFKTLGAEAEKEKAAMQWQPTDYKAILDKHIEENKTFFNKKTPAGSPGGRADVGGYADIQEIENKTEIKSVQFPEILRMIKELGADVTLKNFKKSLGRTYINPEEETAHIALNRSIFDSKLPFNIKTKVLAHELGHIVDALPDYDDKRGNLLGHIASLSKFMKQTYGDLSNKVIKSELKQLTQIWKPFDETVNKSFTQYRYSPHELYADAISVLFNDPALLKETAPQFWKGFFDELNKKEDVRNTFFQTWDLLTKGQDEVLSDRRKVINESFVDAEEKWKVLREEEKQKKENYWFQFKFDFLDKNQRLIDLVKKAQKAGRMVRDDLNPEYMLDERNYIGGRYKVLMERDINPLVQELYRRDLSSHTLGELMLYERIMSAPERADLANPEGLDAQTAKDLLEKMERDLGTETYTFLQQQAVAVRTIFKGLLDEAYNLGMYSDELYTEMKNNPAYATFAVVKYLDTHISGTIMKGTGTLDDVADPFTATVMKMLGTIRGIEDQRVKLGVKTFLDTYHPEEVKKPEYKFDANKNAQVPQESSDDNWKLITYLDKGQVKGYLVDPFIHRAVAYETHDRINIALQILRTLNTKWFRPIYIGFNPGFQSFNLFRDFTRSVMNTPGGDLITNTLKIGADYMKSLPHAINKGFDKPDALVLQMYEKQIFSMSYNDFILGQTDEDKQIDAMLVATGVMEGKEKYNVFMRPFMNTLEFIKDVGDTIEALPKIAGFTRLSGKLPEHEMGAFVRNFLGSPNFLTSGGAKWWSNDVFLFSNAITQGVRSDLHMAFQNPRTRGGWWFKMAESTLLPKLLMFLAAIGVFGYAMKKKMDDQSEYDKTNYIIVPLGSEGDKTVAMRIPQPDLNRLVGGVFWKMLSLFNKDNKTPLADSLAQLFSFTGGQLPSLAPVLTTAQATGQFLSGQNPYDTFRGRTIIPTTSWNAGGWDRAKPFAYWLIQQMGGSIVMGISATEKTGGSPSWLEKFVTAPLLSNVVGRWIKVTNYGQTEQNKTIDTVAQSQSAQFTLKENAALQQALDLYKKSGKTTDDTKAIARGMVLSVFKGQPKNTTNIREANNLVNKFRLDIVKGHTDVNVGAFIDAQTNAQKLALLEHMKESMSPTDYKQLKHNLVHYRIVSSGFVKDAIHAGL